MSVPQGDARIIDRGYRKYEGERLGVRGAMRSVAIYTAQRVLGIHRKARFKIFPALIIIFTFVPTIIFIGVVVLVNQADNFADGGEVVVRSLLSDYPGLYSRIIAAILVFAAFIAPEVLCTDRRSGMLGLYFASTLNRTTYLASKLLTVLGLMLIVTLGPGLLLLIGYGTQGYGPDGLSGYLSTLWRLILAGLGVGMFHTMIALAISSATTRKAAASAGFIMLVMGTGVIIPILIFEADLSVNLWSLNLLLLPIDFAHRIFDQPTPFDFDGRAPMSDRDVYFSMLAWMFAAGLIIVNRYRRIEVSR